MTKIFTQKPVLEWLRNGALLGVLLVGTSLAIGRLWAPHPVGTVPQNSAPERREGLEGAIAEVNHALHQAWSQAGLEPASSADPLVVARRMALALAGTLPSVQEIRGMEQQPRGSELDWYLNHLLDDRRYADYFAERLARAFVGVEDGPFVVYRRRRLVEWIADGLAENRPYDAIARDLISAEGIWTNQPEVNFLTATVEPGMGPNEVKLAARVSRAFLGVRMDCVECHDGKLGNPYKQSDFHQLAAFFAPAQNSLLGITEDKNKQYEYRYLGKPDPQKVPMAVPWSAECLPPDGAARKRLAQWVTHPQNKPFSRAIVNRVWAVLFNKPLHSPVDDLPVQGPFPAALELLAQDFSQHRYDLRRLIRIIVSSEAFQRESRSRDESKPITPAMEQLWAAFPVTRLRPEQVAGSIAQSASLKTLDAKSHVVHRLKELFQSKDFLKRYGDLGEDEFSSDGGTIAQRLLMMNGEIVEGHVKANPIFNASSRIAQLAPDPATAIASAYLACLTRQPTAAELQHFSAKLSHGPQGRAEALTDLSWTLLNSTEFSWNH